MADSTPQTAVLRWVAEEFLPKLFGEPFARKEVRLAPGGSHSFAAVSASSRIVGSISTSAAERARGGLAVGKLNKIRADLYFLMLVDADKRFIAFTDRGMYALMEEERQKGRVPSSIDFYWIEDLPGDLQARLRQSQSAASAEVSPP